MEAIALLANRSSSSRLIEPGPNTQALEQIIRCALRVPDHGRLRPWRFLVIEGEGRNRLGELFVDALRLRNPDASPDVIEKSRTAPLRAPLLIAVIGRLQQHAKVPVIEQHLSAGCAAHTLVLAAQALNFGAIWRTGDNCYDTFIKRGLGLGEEELIVGYIYIGTPMLPARAQPELEPAEFMQTWQGNPVS